MNPVTEAITFGILNPVTELSGTEHLGIKLIPVGKKSQPFYIKTPDESNNLRPGLYMFSDHLLQEETVPVIPTVEPLCEQHIW